MRAAVLDVVQSEHEVVISGKQQNLSRGLAALYCVP
jgi:hypothetical protein